MSNLQKFLSLDEIKRLQKKGDLESVGRLAISMGTVAVDNDLRSYGASLLSKLEKGK